LDFVYVSYAADFVLDGKRHLQGKDDSMTHYIILALAQQKNMNNPNSYNCLRDKKLGKRKTYVPFSRPHSLIG
jgi:hypothetical protein